MSQGFEDQFTAHPDEYVEDIVENFESIMVQPWPNQKAQEITQSDEIEKLRAENERMRQNVKKAMNAIDDGKYSSEVYWILDEALEGKLG